MNNPLTIQRPFAIFIEPGDVVDGRLQWYAKIVGHELDNFTWSDDGPIGAVKEAVILLEGLTDKGEN